LGVPASVSGFSVRFTDSVHGWFLGFFGSSQHIFTSSDRGQNWTERPLPLNHGIRQIRPFDSLRCWMMGDDLGPRVWRTTDGGESWIIEYDGPGDFLQDFDMADTSRGVAVGTSGTVLIYAPVMMGDLNGDEEITTADVVLELNKVFLDAPIAPPEEAADVNCDDNLTPADVVLLLHRAFLGTPFPCRA
jgi:hypothetical protein